MTRYASFPIMCKTVELLTILIIPCSNIIDAFQPGNIHQRRTIKANSFIVTKKLPRCFFSTDPKHDEMAVAETTTNATILQFIGSKSVVSSPMPLPTSPKQSLTDFFQLEETIELLLAGKSNRVEKIKQEETSQYIQGWKKECSYMKSIPPIHNGEGNNEKLYSVSSPGAHFPVLTVKPTVVSGSKLLLPPDVKYPEYQCTLIKDYMVPEGSRILVWIYNQLTGASRKKKKDGEEEDDDSAEQMTHSLLKVSAKPASNGNDDNESNHIIFTASAKLEVNIKFPALLLRILPVSREKANEQGSVSIQEALERDLEPSFDMFYGAYLRWLLLDSKVEDEEEP